MTTRTKAALAAVPDIICIGVRKRCTCKRCWHERKRYRVDYLRGERRRVDASALRAHIESMGALGIGQRTIAEVTGLNHSTLRRIAMGEVNEVLPSTARKIMSFTPLRGAKVPNSALVSATATVKRIQALRALGYPLSWIAQQCGSDKLEIRGDKVTRQRALAVLRVCEQVGDTPGPSARAIEHADKVGWRRPVHYDEDQFYDPKWDGSEPQVAAECRAVQLIGEYDHMKSFGMSDELAAERLGITVAYLRSLLSKRNRGVAPFGPIEATDDRMVG